jgi:hypothetical protein
MGYFLPNRNVVSGSRPEIASTSVYSLLNMAIQQVIVDNFDLLRMFLDGIQDFKNGGPLPEDPMLFVLCQYSQSSLSLHNSVGTNIPVVQILNMSDREDTVVYFIDTQALKQDAFMFENERKFTLKKFLEDKGVTKGVFDIHETSAALFDEFGLKLDGVTDIQLLELATRTGMREDRLSFANCFGKEVSDYKLDERLTYTLQSDTVNLAAPDWSQRPLDKIILFIGKSEICAMPTLCLIKARGQ